MPFTFPHHLHLPHFVAKPLPALYLSLTLRTFAVSLVSIFVPLYILEITGSFLWVLAYFAGLSLLVVAFAIPIGWVVSKLGFRRSAFIGSVLLAIQFYLFAKAWQNLDLLFILPVFDSAKLLLFWVPYHLIFIEDGSADHFGRQVSVAGVIGRLVSAVAPFLGGVVIVAGGFSALFYLALFLILISSLPLFAMPRHPREEFPGWRHILRETFTGGYRDMFFAFWGFRSVVVVAAVVWPVFLFGIAGESYREVGLITSAVLLVSALTTSAAGKASDRIGKRRVLRVGAWVNSIVWLVKAFVRTPVQAFVVDSFNKLVDGIQGVPFEALTYRKAQKRKHHLEFVVRREIFLHFGGFLTTLLMAGLWSLGIPLRALFVIASVGYLVSTLLISSK